MLGLNRNQIMSISVACLGVLMISTTQLTDLFGPGVAKTVVSAAGLLNSMLGATLAIITGQNGIIKDAAAMPGVESIKVNAQANNTLANIALDPNVDKVEATTKDLAAVTKTANGGNT